MTSSRFIHRHRGFTLTELLAVLAITSAFLALASKLFYTTACLSRDSALAQTENARFDSALTALRRNVWNAHQITISDPQHATIEDSSGTKIVWQIENNSDLLRIATTQTRWPATAQGLAFSKDASQLVLNLKPEGQLRLVPLSALTRSTP